MNRKNDSFEEEPADFTSEFNHQSSEELAGFLVDNEQIFKYPWSEYEGYSLLESVKSIFFKTNLKISSVNHT